VKRASRIFSAFFARDLTMATSYRLDFVLSVGRALFPLLVLYLPAELMGDIESTREYGGFLPFSIIGVGTMNFFMATYGSFANGLRSEQSMGTLEAVLMAPITLPVLVLAAATWNFVWSAASAALFIGGGALLYDVALPGDFGLALLFVAVTTLVFVSIGIFSASFAMVWKRGDPIGPLVSTVFFLLGGIIYPPTILPAWLAALSSTLPITHAVEALREVLLQDAGFGQVAGHLWVLCSYALVLFPASLYAFARAVRKATRDGTLLQF